MSCTIWLMVGHFGVKQLYLDKTLHMQWSILKEIMVDLDISRHMIIECIIRLMFIFMFLH